MHVSGVVHVAGEYTWSVLALSTFPHLVHVSAFIHVAFPDELCPNAALITVLHLVHVCAVVHVAAAPGLCPNAEPCLSPQFTHVSGVVHVAGEYTWSALA